jgi:hypothetical protein
VALLHQLPSYLPREARQSLSLSFSIPPYSLSHSLPFVRVPLHPATVTMPTFLPPSLSLSTMATMMASTTVTVGSHAAAGRPPLGRPVARCGDTLHNSEAGGQIQPVLWGGGGCAARMRSTFGRLPLSSWLRGAPPGFSLEDDGDQASTSSTGRGHAFVVRCCDPEPRTRPQPPPPLLRLRLPARDHGKRRGGDGNGLDLGRRGNGDGLDLGPTGLGLGGNFFYL